MKATTDSYTTFLENNGANLKQQLPPNTINIQSLGICILTWYKGILLNKKEEIEHQSIFKKKLHCIKYKR